MNKTYDLTASHIKYLIALQKLSNGKNGVRCVDIANALCVSKPSVHTMIRTLGKLNFVRYERYGDVFLKEEGRKIAEKYNIYARTLKLCFNGFFNEETDINNAVFAFLAEIEPENIVMLKEFNIRELHKRVS